MSKTALYLFVCKRNYNQTLALHGHNSISASWAFGALRAQAAYLIENGTLGLCV